MEYKGLTLDRFQEDSIAALDKNHSVVVSAPTGSGKTLIADYIIGKDLKKGIKVIYTAPIKALSNQKFKEFSADFGEENIGLLTGDIVRNPGAPILIMTTEIYRNMALIGDPMINEVSYVIFDEIHYINDVERGYVWEESIIFSKDHVRFLCLSATIPNADEFADWIKAIKKHEVEVIKNDKRNVPLERKFFDTELGITSLREIKDIIDIPSHDYIRGKSRRRRPRVTPPSHINLIREIKDKLPCFFFAFSRKICQKNAVELAKTRMFQVNPEISSFIVKKLSSAPVEINNLKSTQMLRQTLPYGIGFHHAGLIPIIKELVEELFSKGLIKVLYTTETFAVGINMPAKTVCFESLRKYDGINFRFLNSKEYFQIAGRAGRRGIDKQGFSYAMLDRRDFDYPLINKMTTADVDPIRSQFRLSINTCLNLIKQHDQTEINRILCMNFYTYQKYHQDFDKVSKAEIFNNFKNIKKKLVKMHHIENDILTEKGEFASKIYSDEIITAEIFATKFKDNLNEAHLLMLLACLAYEPKENTRFFTRLPSNMVKDVKNKINSHPFLGKQKQFKQIDRLTAFIDPIYHGKTIFDVIKNSNLLEGDIFRLFRQILDRIGQIRKATADNQLDKLLQNCARIVDESMEDLDVI